MLMIAPIHLLKKHEIVDKDKLHRLQERQEGQDIG